MRAYWLCKTEPTTYSIDDFVREKITQWDGVRNYQARNNLRAMGKGDYVLIYHSVTEPVGVAGLAVVVKEAYPDALQFDRKSEYFDPKSKFDKPTWVAPDLRVLEKFPRVLPLKLLKESKSLKGMELFRTSRLSVQRASAAEYKAILGLSRNLGG